MAAETPHGSHGSLAGLHKRHRPHAATIQVREMQEKCGHLNEGPAHGEMFLIVPAVPAHWSTCGELGQANPFQWLAEKHERSIPSREEHIGEKRGGRGAGLCCTKRKTLGARDWAKSGL